MFLKCLIPGPHNLKNKIDVYLQQLIDELQTLWNKGVDTYDVHKDQTFKMMVALMWTINDFSAYGMWSGQSTHGAFLVQYAKIGNVGVTYDMIEKYRGLIVIAAFHPKTMHSDEITVRSLRTEQ